MSRLADAAPVLVFDVWLNNIVLEYVQSVPMANAHVQDERFRHILRLRFGVPCVTPLADWKCNCRGHGGPRARAIIRTWV